ncbi:MAG: alpha/beta fold hydrolase [Pseudomonadota bacterium]
MSSLRSALVCALLVSLFVPSTAVKAQSADAALPTPLPIAEYGKLPDVEHSAISPSGKRAAFITTVKGRRVLVAIEDQTKGLTSVAVGEMKVRYIRWIGEDRLLLVTSQTEDLSYRFTTDKAEFYVGRVIPMSNKDKAGLIFGNVPRLIDSIRGSYGIREIGGRYYGYFGAIELERRGSSASPYQFKHGRPYLYRVDLQTFKTKKIANAAGEGRSKDWLIDRAGEVAATLTVNDTTGKWDVKDPDGRVIAKGTNPGARIGLVGLGSDGTTAIISESVEGFSNWFEVPLAGGEPKPFLEDQDWNRLFFDDQTGHLMGYIVGEADAEKPVFYDKALEKKAGRVLRAFSAYESRIIDWTSDLSAALVHTSGNQDSGTIYAVDLATSRANAIAYERMAIGPERVGPISTFEYKASDGLEMDGILTLPPGREPNQLPLVMLPHGGPHRSDSVSFNWWAQAFASRGYAVFQPNFRGSTNRDGEFKRAGYGEWGRKMQTDKSDGLNALADAGIIDPARVCIVGGSYGGYAALAGVTLQSGIYRCAVAVAPVSDIRNMYSEDYRATGRDRTTKVALLEQLGPRESWDAVSPLRAAARASAPIMLIHGKDDVVVPYSHSRKMADKLKDADKPHQLITLEGEDHWLSLSKTRQMMLEQSIGFVMEHNPPD